MSADVGPAGGTVKLSGTPSTLGVPVELRIPPNALTNTVTIRITETSKAPPGGFGDYSPIYHFEPNELTFKVPVHVRIPFNSGDLPPASSHVIPKQLSIYWSGDSDACALEPLADNYVNAGFNEASVSRLGWGIVGVSPLGEGCP